MLKPPKVQLFVTCIVDNLFPQAGTGVVTVLERLGIGVEFPPQQTCCGQPAYNAGFHSEARRVALRFLDVFSRSAAPIVAPSGSCVAIVRHSFPALFQHEPDNLQRAQALAARTYEFSEFLVDVLGVTDVGAVFNAKLTYHPSCHLARDLGITDQPHRLLANVRGAHFIPLPHAEDCCGFGGFFAIKHEDLSGALLDKKLAHARTTGAEVMVGCDFSCLTHMQGGLLRDGSPIKCMHLAEVLAATAETPERT